MALLWITVMFSIWMAVFFPTSVQSDPIVIDFNKCRESQYQLSPNDPTIESIQCCPPAPSSDTRIIYGAPPPSTSYTRIRKGAHCTDAAYAAQLDKAYSLMRALPDDDPRSLTQQWYLHCSYCGGAFYYGANSTGIDIHFSWLFLPWHRLFLFFHERILQSLLGDPTFSLSYWNWDGPFTVGDGSSSNGACLTTGHDFPAAYSSPSSAAYDSNRSENAKGNGRLKFPDLTFSPTEPAVDQPLYNASAEMLIQSNLNVMYNAMVSGGTTAMTFMGRAYRAGDLQGNPSSTGGGGTLELSAHAGAHFWTGQDPPIGIDMGQLAYSARDPVFFSHHSNVDRLFQVWKSIGPVLGEDREYYSDPDFLNAAFLFYDENKDLRQVTVSDALSTENLGYAYQPANDAAWVFYNTTRCSSMNYTTLMNQANSLPVPTKESDGFYHLQNGTPLVMIVSLPSDTSGADQFLVIDGITLDRNVDGGFDVFVNLLYPNSYASPWMCAEYLGRFVTMGTTESNQLMTWTQSISKTLTSIQAPSPPSQLVVTILPLTRSTGTESIAFTSMTVSTSGS